MFKCEKCGAKFYGWATNETCDCGGKLKPKEKDDDGHFEMPTYLQMIRHSPRQAIQEILCCAVILAIMFGALYFKEILAFFTRL